MTEISKGRYWDEGVKIVSGCTRCSDGCKNCWSLAMENRFAKRDKLGLPLPSANKIIIHPERLSRFNTRKPKVFALWNDLFHESVPETFIIQVLKSMYKYKHNTYLLLTKRPKQMAGLMCRLDTATTARFLLQEFDGENVPDTANLGIVDVWPNVYFGLTVCNQQEADEKIPIFLQVPGKKFLSIESCLGVIDLSWSWIDRARFFDLVGGTIDAVILGGETGPGARPVHPDWVRSVRDQCAAAGVPFFFKQWGEWAIRDSKIHGDIPKNPTIRLGENGLDTRNLNNCIDAGNEVYMQRVGRNKAGRILDGRTHDDLPWVKEGKC